MKLWSSNTLTFPWRGLVQPFRRLGVKVEVPITKSRHFEHCGPLPNLYITSNIMVGLATPL